MCPCLHIDKNNIECLFWCTSRDWHRPTHIKKCVYESYRLDSYQLDSYRLDSYRLDSYRLQFTHVQFTSNWITLTANLWFTSNWITYWEPSTLPPWPLCGSELLGNSLLHSLCGSELLVNSLPHSLCGSWLSSNSLPHSLCGSWLPSNSLPTAHSVFRQREQGI